ncbi:MAG: glucose-1-phosphate thymidylyltransferase [Candidatus Aenigmatarchaeota archaeon]
MRGLILLGGKGTRLRPLTYTGQKQLLKIANKPMCVFAIESLKKAGIEEIGLIVGHTKERIENTKNVLGDGSKWGVKFTYIEQDEPRGLAHAVSISKDFLGNEPFIVFLGDNLLQGGINKFVKDFENSNLDAKILLTKHKNPSRFGVAEFDKNGELIGLVEKPEKPPSDYVIIGIYFFRSSVFDFINKLKPSKRGELEITDTLDMMIKDKNTKVGFDFVEGWWKDTGRPEDILEANHLVLSDIKGEIKGVIEDGVKIIGEVVIGNGTIVKKGSTIKGPVIIGENCIVGPKTYIGPYTSLGDKVEIKNTEIESSIVLDECKIKSKKRIIDSLIGEMSIIEDDGLIPKGIKLVVGDNSKISL